MESPPKGGSGASGPDTPGRRMDFDAVIYTRNHGSFQCSASRVEGVVDKADRKKRLDADAVIPGRITYRPLTRA
ncbi:MAG: hypothetical protein ACQET7_09225 [Thermodesulfobacteriota bacterium]